MPKAVKKWKDQIRDTALDLFDRGFGVIPCKDKQAIWQGWPDDRRTRAELDRVLSNGQDLNIAIALNQCDLIDVEYDNAEGKAKLLDIFDGEIPETPTFESPRGGHLLFKRPEGLPKKAVVKIEGLEFRIGHGKGALSVLPPSKGRTWLKGLSLDDIEPAELPDHVVELLKAPESKPKVISNGEKVGEGNRNEHLFRIGCSLKSAGADEETIRIALESENRNSLISSISDIEVLKVVSSCISYDSGNYFNSFNSFETPEINESAYHGFAGKVVEKLEPNTEAPPVAMLGQFLSMFGMMIGPKPFVYAGTEQPARVPVNLVAPTSDGRKGTSCSMVKKVFNNITDPLVQSVWNQQCMGGLSSGEGLIAQVADRTETDKKGKKKIIKVEKRLLVVEPEFAKVLTHCRREGNILSHVLRECFDSGNLQTMTRESSLRANDAHVVVIGHITPEELKKRLTDTDMANGFANRFLWLSVKSNKDLPDGKPTDESILQELGKELTGRISYVRKNITVVERDKEANELWGSVYSSLKRNKPGLRGQMLARGETIVIRLALIYALLDKSSYITLHHLQAALAIWQYNVDSVGMIFGDKSGEDLETRVFEVLHKPINKTAIYTHIQAKKKDLDAALAALEAKGKIKLVKDTKRGRGRKKEIWQRV